MREVKTMAVFEGYVLVAFEDGSLWKFVPDNDPKYVRWTQVTLPPSD